jgi:hypothetical protein
MLWAYHDSHARSLHVRRGLGRITFCAFLLLTIGMSANYDLSMYMPRHHLLQWTFFVAVAYLVITYWVVRVADHARLIRVILVQGVLLVTSLAVFVAYHMQHDASSLPDSYDWSFHTQLAIPAFLALVLAPWIAVMALRTEPPGVRPLA